MTPEQVQAIVDSRVRVIKDRYREGELRKGTRGDTAMPWPEFWPGYNQAVKERDELAVHIEYGVFPEHLIRARSPNQTDVEFEYVRANFKQVTLPNSPRPLPPPVTLLPAEKSCIAHLEGLAPPREFG